MYEFLKIMMVVCEVAMIIGFVFFVAFQAYFWSDRDHSKTFFMFALYSLLGVSICGWFIHGCALNTGAIVPAVAVLLIMAQFCFFKERWQNFHVKERSLFKKLKKTHIFAILVLILCFSGGYGYCKKQKADYQRTHADMYVVVGFNVKAADDGIISVYDTDDDHLFVALRPVNRFKAKPRVLISKKYHLGDTVLMFHDKPIS